MHGLEELQPGQYRDCVIQLIHEGPRGSSMHDKKACVHWVCAELREHGWTCHEVQDLVRTRNQSWAHSINADKLPTVLSYIEWAFHQESTPITCHSTGIIYGDHCDRRKTECRYFQDHRNAWNRLVLDKKIDVFSNSGWPEYLQRTEQASGHIACDIMLALEKTRHERHLPPEAEVFIGIRDIAARINLKRRFPIDLMTISRATHILEGEGLLMIRRGKPGTHSKKANGYTIPLKFPMPPGGAPHIPHSLNEIYCVTSGVGAGVSVGAVGWVSGCGGLLVPPSSILVSGVGGVGAQTSGVEGGWARP